MTVINTNTAATITANALTKNERAMSQTMERLSTGQRINSPLMMRLVWLYPAA
jgi:flagellin